MPFSAPARLHQQVHRCPSRAVLRCADAAAVLQAPCQHNFCLGCFNRWAAQGKKTCPTCRTPFPAKFAANPRINTALASVIRSAKLGVAATAAKRPIARPCDEERPDEAFRQASVISKASPES